ncbi:hypothetical protein OCU04_004431 [Sclerotinia nivalis]|uniref:LysM domain-containing protein n=1 Tax=Sclerotinia nivalis TaxID=352851 RepID=A0A9X0DKL8_9HELO|nr:hypothetical protein OCU04_004431 [Sclerotinia nivalis]
MAKQNTTSEPIIGYHCIGDFLYTEGDVNYVLYDEFASSYNITVTELFALNSWVESDCSGLFADLNFWKYRSVCVGVGNPTTTTAAAAPTQSGMLPGCLKLHTAVAGDSCSSIRDLYGITFAQLFAWNPAIESDCSLLIIGDAYCVSVPTTSMSITMTSTTNPPATAPIQTGMVSSCNQYYITKGGGRMRLYHTRI